MKEKETIYTERAPEAIGPYNQAVVVEDTIYISGQIGLKPESMEFAGSDIESQAKQVMENLKAILEEAGSSFGQVIKISIYLDDMDNFSSVNKIYGSYFSDDSLPSRETVAVKTLPKNALVEISCIAYR